MGMSEALVSDLREALDTAVCDKEEARSRSASSMKVVEAECDRMRHRIELLSSELEFAQRAEAATASEMDVVGKKLQGSEDRCNSRIDEAECQSRRALDKLQEDNNKLLQKFMVADQERSRLHKQLSAEQERNFSVHRTLQAEAAQLQDLQIGEKASAMAQAKNDSLRVQSLESENIRLQAQAAELARQLASLESLNQSLRVRV